MTTLYSNELVENSFLDRSNQIGFLRDEPEEYKFFSTESFKREIYPQNIESTFKDGQKYLIPQTFVEIRLSDQ